MDINYFNYYKILNIPIDANNDEIKFAYRKLVRIHHPDKGGAKEVFQQIQKAYEILSNPEKRKIYDQNLKFTQEEMTQNSFEDEKEEIYEDEYKNKIIANCIRNVGNFSKMKMDYLIDKKNYNPDLLKSVLEQTSPKLVALFNEIQKLDAQDLKEHGKHFKHMIFTDANNAMYGIKIIASAFNAYGYNLAQSKSLDILEKEKLQKTRGNNFAVLLSKTLFKTQMTVKQRKSLLNLYNTRPDNIEGDYVRFIILDNGFKEGIDLYDVKYVHLFEKLGVSADEKQAIGRATRFCGQKGLKFNPKYGWPLFVLRYEIIIPSFFLQNKGINENEFTYMNDLYLKYTKVDKNKVQFTNELDNLIQESSVDADLTREIHLFNINYPSEKFGGANNSQLVKYRRSKIAPEKIMSYIEMREYINKYFYKFKYENVKLQNNCIVSKTDKNVKKISKYGNIVKFTPTQDFIRHFFTNDSAYKGILLYHSVGSGKTCTAIATASNSFEKDNYTILWVTRHTLKSDIWKNIYNQVCHIDLQTKIKSGKLKFSDNIKNPQKYLPKNWIPPISYKQFSNMLLQKNKIYHEMVKRNGKQDPLRKTLVIIDEAHKIYSPTVESKEKPNTNILEKMIQNSYSVSGKDSVRILAMTGTPYTKDPMEIIKLLNLMRPASKQLPSQFKHFSKIYLDNNGSFTPSGIEKFQNEISGYISYLNRSQDARNFAYPIIKDIFVPLTDTNKTQLDKNIIELNERIKRLQNDKNCKQNKIDNELEILKQKYKNDMNNCKKLKKDEQKNCKNTTKEIFNKNKINIKEKTKQKIESCKKQNEVLITNLKNQIKKTKSQIKNDLSQKTVLKKCISNK